MADYNALLESISAKISDYRIGEIPAIGPDHVERWIQQFEDAAQTPILKEIDHVLNTTYVSRKVLDNYWSALIKTEKLAGSNPEAFWRAAKFLRIQQGGASQTKMLDVLDDALVANFGFDTHTPDQADGAFIYLDDGLFSGNRLYQDVKSWIDAAPSRIVLHVIVIASHAYGSWRAQKRIADLAKEKGKKIRITVWRSIELEDRKSDINDSDVLRPTKIPDDPDVHGYVQDLDAAGYPPALRAGNSIGKRKIFSSPEGRELLEQQFLIAGAKIRKMCPNLADVMRPLGFHGLRMLGFGSLFVTYRNCPNNCPLALWVGEPWHALFPRKTNSDVARERLFIDWA